MVLLAPAPKIQTVGYVRWLIIQMNGGSTAATVKTVVHESASREHLAPETQRLLSLAETRRHRLTARPRFLRSPVHWMAVLFIRDSLPNDSLSCARSTAVVPLLTCRVAAELN